MSVACIRACPERRSRCGSQLQAHAPGSNRARALMTKPPAGTRGRSLWAAVASERGRMTASIAESRQQSSPECGEQRPSKNIVRIISILLWYFPNRPGAAGWLHLATYRHECARVMCVLWAVHLGLGKQGVSPSFSGGFCWADAEYALVSPAAPPPVALRLSSVRLLLTGPFHWPHR